MINNGRLIGIIPARGGSKGIPKKNLVNLSGKPLINWTIDEAKKLSVIDELIVSSDDEGIIACAQEAGCKTPFKRPDHLATDQASTIDVIIHALESYSDYEYVLLLQPTSPLRKAKDILNAIDLMVKKKAPACISISPVECKPEWMFYLGKSKNLEKVLKSENIKTRRQDLEKAFIPNGAIYLAETSFLREKKTFFSDKTVGYIMPAELSIDIDKVEDLKSCELKLKY